MDIEQQKNDDAPISDFRKYAYRMWADTRQPMLDDIRKTGKTWGMVNYIKNPWDALAMGISSAGASIGDRSLSEDASDRRAKLLSDAERAMVDKNKGNTKFNKNYDNAISAWQMMKTRGVLP